MLKCDKASVLFSSALTLSPRLVMNRLWSKSGSAVRTSRKTDKLGYEQHKFTHTLKLTIIFIQHLPGYFAIFQLVPNLGSSPVVLPHIETNLFPWYLLMSKLKLKSANIHAFLLPFPIRISSPPTAQQQIQSSYDFIIGFKRLGWKYTLIKV